MIQGLRRREDVARSMRTVFDRMPPQYLRVVQAPGDYAAQPRLRCESVRALHRDVLALAPDDRHAALRGMPCKA